MGDSAAHEQTTRPARVVTAPVVAVVLALLVGLGAVAFVRAGWTDPYRPGTSHAVTVQLNGCNRPGSLTLGGRLWTSHDRLPPTWPNPPMVGGAEAQVPGTLRVTEPDRATFTADQGGSVTFVRLGEHAFDDLSCPIR